MFSPLRGLRRGFRGVSSVGGIGRNAGSNEGARFAGMALIEATAWP
jgi:hypothetical protein